MPKKAVKKTEEVKKVEMTDAEKEALIPVYVDKWIALQTVQSTDEEIIQTIRDMWVELGEQPPEVKIFDSPKACKAEKLDDSFDYWSLWTACSAGTYDFAKAIGIEFDESKLELFTRWSLCCPYIYANTNTVHVSRKPVAIHWNEAGQLHNDEGMSLSFADGWGIYTLNNVAVPEKVVMRPKEQTIEEINSEENEEIKRLRIERYGWLDYMKGIGAEKIDEYQNDIEGTKEFLLRGYNNMTILLCICPSTAKEFTLEVPPTIKTCVEAQDWLSSGLSKRIISAS